MKRQLNPDQIFSCMMDAVVRQGGKDFQAIALGIRPLSQAALMWLQASEVWKRQETKTVDLMSDNALNETEKEYPFLMVTSVIKGKPEPLRTELKESFNETKQLYEDTCVDENDDAKRSISKGGQTIAYYAPQFFNGRLDAEIFAGVFGESMDDNENAMSLFTDLLEAACRNDVESELISRDVPEGGI